MRSLRCWFIRSGNRQTDAEFTDLVNWDLSRDGDGRLVVDGIDAPQIVQRFGTPALIVNSARLERDAKDILSAIANAPGGSKVLYSYKTNCIPGILAELHKMGVGAEVISPYELWLAEKLGVPGNMIVYNGVAKDEASIARAIKLGVVAINVDNLEEIERIWSVAKKLGKRVNIGVRLGLSEDTQFGLDVATGEAFAGCRRISQLQDYLNMSCVHFNVTSNARSAELHKRCTLEALDFIRKLNTKLQLKVEYLDVGGGFGTPTTKNMSGFEYGLYRLFGLLPKPPPITDFQPIDVSIKEIVNAMVGYAERYRLEVPKLIIEPGRFITSRAEFLLTKVHALKKKADGKIFAISDAGRLSVAFPCDFEYHQVFIANRDEKGDRINYQIMGRVCTSADWLMKNKNMPELKAGDILAVMDAGAYFSSYSMNFAYQRPPIVVIGEGETRIIRREETFEHLVAMDSHWCEN